MTEVIGIKVIEGSLLSRLATGGPTTGWRIRASVVIMPGGYEAVLRLLAFETNTSLDQTRGDIFVISKAGLGMADATVGRAASPMHGACAWPLDVLRPGIMATDMSFRR